MNITLSTEQKIKIMWWKQQFETDGSIAFSYHLVPKNKQFYCYYIEAHKNGNNNDNVGLLFVGEEFVL